MRLIVTACASLMLTRVAHAEVVAGFTSNAR
jgi:hypothetical protein